MKLLIRASGESKFKDYLINIYIFIHFNSLCTEEKSLLYYANLLHIYSSPYTYSTIEFINYFMFCLGNSQKLILYIYINIIILL